MILRARIPYLAKSKALLNYILHGFQKFHVYSEGLHIEKKDALKANRIYSVVRGEFILPKYSQFSLSRLRFSRITAYLEEKIWSLFLHKNLKSGYKILWKRADITPGEQFLSFSTIFSIYISNLRCQRT